jgi:hypothetical protein
MGVFVVMESKDKIIRSVIKETERSLSFIEMNIIPLWGRRIEGYEGEKNGVEKNWGTISIR